MPDVTYKIIIENGASDGSSGGTSKTTSTKNSASDTGWLGDVYSQYNKVMKFAPVAAAVGFAKNMFSWQMSLVGRNTGSALTQQKINAGMQIAGQALSTGGLLIGGIATANPLMVIAGFASGVNSLIGYAQEREQFNYERRMERMELEYLRERAGASYNRSRLGG